MRSCKTLVLLFTVLWEGGGVQRWILSHTDFVIKSSIPTDKIRPLSPSLR